MYVCVCNAVTERDVAKAVKAGARSVRDLRDQLGVAAECGRCAECAQACLREHGVSSRRGVSVSAQAPAIIHLHRSNCDHEGRQESLAAA